uniref:TPT domain-containing protein n=1 Tax=Heterorhabditis bacteriophora TaxID=37862 RepID=A0A1I7XMZ2_HETBA
METKYIKNKGQYFVLCMFKSIILGYGTDSNSGVNKCSAVMVLKIALIALLYYPLSIGLTFYQKWFIKNYKLPLFVVCGHYIFKWLAAIIIRFVCECFSKKRLRLSLKDQLRWLAPIGICASLDIGLSNWALEYVTVSLYTMAKSSSILFIVAFSLLLKLERWRPALGLESGFIAIGLFLFTWQSSQLDLTGLLLVELAASCTGIRWTVSQMVMQREEQAIRHPLDMVAHVQPWMLIPIIPLIIAFEGKYFFVLILLTCIVQYGPLFRDLCTWTSAAYDIVWRSSCIFNGAVRPRPAVLADDTRKLLLEEGDN